MPRARRVPAPKASARAALLAANPWLTEEDLGTGRRKAGKRMPRVAAPDEPPGGDPADDSDSSDTPDDPPPLPPPLGAPQGMEVGEADAEMVVHEDPGPAPPALLELRREFWWEDQERMHFYTRFLGGWWTLAHRGVECESIAGLARAHAESWCDIYGFPGKNCSRSACTDATARSSWQENLTDVRITITCSWWTVASSMTSSTLKKS